MTDLLETMDAAAAALLKAVGLSDTTESDTASGGGPSVSERVKAFDSILAYVQWREKLKPPAPDPKPKKEPGAQFRRMREQYSGAPKRGAGRGANGAADPADATD